MTSTILATYNTVQEAQDAIRDLTNSGFNPADIGLATYNRDDTDYDGDVKGDEGASFGATLGAAFGAVAGLMAITIPGIGPVIAAGPLAAALGALTGAGIGAVTGGVTGGVTAALVDLGIPEEDAGYYAESLRRGAALVSVNVTEIDADRATTILQNYHPIDIDRRVADWTASGWQGFEPEIDANTEDELAKVRMMNEGHVAAGNTSRAGNDQGVRRYPRSDS